VKKENKKEKEREERKIKLSERKQNQTEIDRRRQFGAQTGSILKLQTKQNIFKTSRCKFRVKNKKERFKLTQDGERERYTAIENDKEKKTESKDRNS
jgi:hypothetical protein